MTEVQRAMLETLVTTQINVIARYRVPRGKDGEIEELLAIKKELQHAGT